MTGRRRKLSLGIAIDFGGSMTKIIAGLPDGRWCAMAMEPEVLEVPLESVEQLKNNSYSESRPKDRTWVKVGDKAYAVGYLARSHFGSSTGLSLSLLKSDLAIYKIMAALWVIVSMFNLRHGLSVAISCVLPPGEYQDREAFQDNLEVALTEFYTPTGLMRVKLKEFACKPEGLGSIMMYHSHKGVQHRQKTVSAVVMLGYRNASVMVCSRGSVSNFNSSDLGFVQFLKRVVNKTVGQTPERLAPILVKAEEMGDEKVLNSLLLHQSASDREIELANLQNGISTSKTEYLIVLLNWLRENFPSELDEVILCGGTVDYFASSLEECFKKYQIVWHSDVKLPTELTNMGYGHRFLDVWGLWQWWLCQVPLVNKPIAS